MEANAPHDVARSGFRHVRVCNDCDHRIKDDGTCGCAKTHPFSRGTEITVCSDPDGIHPISLGTVGRVGNGAFRVQGTKLWYTFAGAPAGGGATGHARLRKPGDDAVVGERFAAEDRARRFAEAKKSLDQAKAEASRHKTYQAAAIAEALKKESEAAGVNPVAEGEAARLKAVHAAEARRATLSREAATKREEAARTGAMVATHQAKVDQLTELVESIRKEDYVTWIMEL